MNKTYLEINFANNGGIVARFTGVGTLGDAIPGGNFLTDMINKVTGEDPILTKAAQSVKEEEELQSGYYIFPTALEFTQWFMKNFDSDK